MKSISFALLCVIGLGCVTYTSAQGCHLRELDLCSATLVVLVQNPNGLATTEEEVDRQCIYLNEAEACFGNYSQRCQTRDQREFGRYLLNDSEQEGRGASLLRQYCTGGSELRNKYLEHAECLNRAYKLQRPCIKDLQTALESLNDINWNQRISYGCCAYRRFTSCMEDLVVKECGEEARDFGNFIIRVAVSRFPEIVCHKGYNPKSRKCRRILPRPGTEPKGARSTSVIGRLFSAYTGV